MKTVNIVGGGVFGLSAGLEFLDRGYDVRIFEQGRIPHEEAASTDITKMVRADYGSDRIYTELMVDTFEKWESWNRSFKKPLYHEVGFLLLTKNKIEKGDFEYESLSTFSDFEFPVVRLNEDILQSSFPSWNSELYTDGYYNRKGGWVESGNVLEELSEWIKKRGGRIYEQEGFGSFIEQGSRVIGIRTERQEDHMADYTIIAAGSWTPFIFPELSELIWPSRQPVFHLRVENGDLFEADKFPGWAADISKTGWYGFPIQPGGILKIANHGLGLNEHPSADIQMPEVYKNALKEFLEESFPQLIDSPVVKTRLCTYCDTFDNDFLIDYYPDRPGLLIATGGSGHGFKFAPVLGSIIADVLENKPNKYKQKFQWRYPDKKKFEASRCESF